MKKIQVVTLSKMEEMRKYFNDYLVELSKFDPDIKFDKQGIPIYKWYNCYWEDKSRYPLFFICDNKVAGLAMIRELENMVYDIAEFYVLPSFRKDGNAIWFATELTNLFDGQFIFSTRFTNPRAINFWNKFAMQFDNSFVEDDKIWRSWTIRKNKINSHTLNLNPIYFDLIKCNQKTLEGRLNDDKRKNYNIGDYITFFKEPEKSETIKAIILDKFIFVDFDQMADNISKEDLGFENQTKQQMIEVYRTIYKKEDENKYGVIVFKIKVIS